MNEDVTPNPGKPPLLTVVVPCYNEQDAVHEIVRKLKKVLVDIASRGEIAGDSAILFVDDGSSDDTWSLIVRYAADDSAVHGLKLSRNFGHQSAILAGMLRAGGDVVITIDADLQDPPEIISDMMRAHRAGAEIVFGVRDDRSVDSGFKRFTAEIYYRLLRSMGANVIFNHADFRLLGRTALEALRDYGETNLFLRGIVQLLGFRQALVFYRREPRFAGETKYSLRKMFRLSLDGITSFSTLPLRLITLAGFSVSFLAFCAGLWAFAAWFYKADTVPGWTSVVLPMYFLGGIQLLSIGILGEYLGKNYIETKRRPRFIVDKSI